MKYTLHFMPKAMTGMAEIRAYIAADNPVRAESFALELWSGIQSLKSMPLRCPLAPEATKKGREIRHHLFQDYRVLFVVKRSIVNVLRVIHGARIHYDGSRA